MREEQLLQVILSAVFLLGLAGLVFTGIIPGLGGSGVSDVAEDGATTWIEDYRADFYLNGTIEERLQYQSRGDVKRLARTWNYPISSQELGRTYVQIINRSILSGAMAYENDWQGGLGIASANGSMTAIPAPPHEQSHLKTVASLAEKNEAGCYMPGYFPPGVHRIDYIFKIHPPVEYDEKYSHLNIMLADEHLPYEQVVIRVHDPQGKIDRLFTHPSMAMVEQGGIWHIQGSSPKDRLLEVEMLLSPDAIQAVDGFPRHVEDVLGKTLSANPETPVSSSMVIDSSADARVLKYSADLYLNGTIAEAFVYSIQKSNAIRMLYRNWKIPLSTVRLGVPYVELFRVSVPPGSVPYANLDGTARILAANGSYYSSSQYDLWSLASDISPERNEAGYYIYGHPGSQTFPVGYRARIHPTLFCDDRWCLFSLDLAAKNLPFRNIQLRLHDPGGNISKVLVNPLLTVSRHGLDWIISGRSSQNHPLQIRVLLDKKAALSLPGFIVRSQDVMGRAVLEEASAAREHKLLAQFSAIISTVLRLMVLAAPLILLFIYRRYGKERTFLVPAMLSAVPTLRKPWVVNLVFKDDPFDFDRDGFFATILDLQRRKILDMQSDSSRIRITLRQDAEPVQDAYEENVLRFLKRYADNGVWDTRAFSARIEDLRTRGYRDDSALAKLDDLKLEMLDLMNSPGEDSSQRVSREFFSLHLRGRGIMVAVPIALMIAASILSASLADIYPDFKISLYASSILFLQSLIAAFAAPQAIFGRWNGDYYKEKQEWDAFGAFLEDYAMMQRYAPSDLAIWKEWLVYGTALGRGEGVSRAMKSMNVPDLARESSLFAFSYSFSSALERASEHVVTRAEEEQKARSSSSGGGGGFGGGGGCGGGGGGAR